MNMGNSPKLPEEGCSFEFFKRSVGPILVDYCGTIPGNEQREYNLTNDGAPVSNDDIVGFVAYNIEAGTMIRLYDNSDGHLDDDWCEIIFKKSQQRIKITNLEQCIDNRDIRMIYVADNGLKGKVSRVEVEPRKYTTPNEYPFYLAFYCGNNFTDGLAGCISSKGSYNLTKGGQPVPNDEARSLIFHAVPAMSIEVYDNSEGSTNDDYCKISVTKPISADDPFGIPTFEVSATYSDEGVETVYHKENGLDGKISLIKIS